MAAIIGELSITMDDGTVLRDRTDVGLAGRWAEHVYGAEVWQGMSFRDRTRAVSDALAELRRAYGVVT